MDLERRKRGPKAPMQTTGIEKEQKEVRVERKVQRKIGIGKTLGWQSQRAHHLKLNHPRLYFCF